MWLISIDGGTTNTRLVLIKDGVVKCIKRLSIGARDSLVDGHNSYREVLSTGIGQLLLENELSEKDIKSIVVSGMIC
ncbi:MAG: 2-dehydro-3-deoxygalactonokinase, partial [Clostridia bacterium]|nr:2-dehydro-3-deoxygalactonokinase [Clostridia bacterium]